MESKYFNEITRLIRQAHLRPTTKHEIKFKFKNVFGAVGSYVNGHIFITCGKFGVALKLPPETLAALFKDKDIQHLKYFRKGHMKKEYAVIPKRILNNKRQFKKLLDKSIV